MAVGRNCEGRAPPPSKETGVSDMNQLQGKIAVITGGTSCIGLAAAEVFLREGARAAKMKVAAMSASSEANSGGRPGK